LVVIMFELTGELKYMLPVMITVMVSKWVGDAFGRDSIYDEHILLNEYPFLDNKWEPLFKGKVNEIMKSDNLRVIEAAGNTVGSLRNLLDETSFTGFPVVKSRAEMIIYGFISRNELRQALDTITQNPQLNDSTRCYFTEDMPFYESTTYCDMRSWMDLTPIQISSETPLNILFDLFKRLGLRCLLVCDQGKLVGLVTKKDLLQHIAITFNHKTRTFNPSTQGPE